MQLNIKKLKYEMKRLDWNKTRLAKEMGMSRQALRLYFDEDTTLKRVEKMAKALKLSSGKDLLI